MAKGHSLKRIEKDGRGLVDVKNGKVANFAGKSRILRPGERERAGEKTVTLVLVGSTAGKIGPYLASNISSPSLSLCLLLC